MPSKEFIDPSDKLADNQGDDIMASLVDRYSRDKEDEADKAEEKKSLSLTQFVL